MAQRRGRKSHKIRTALMVCAVICAAGMSGMLYMRQKVTETYADDDGSTAQSETVETGSLSTTVSGSGTLEAVGLTDVIIPANVDVSRIMYAQGAEVSEGDLLFSVDSASVLKAMKNTQDQIDTLDESLEDASADEVSSSLTSGVSGRVKKIYAAAEDDVSSVMYNSGALMTLSLDGYMAVKIPTGLLNEGDSVTVTASDGSVYTGTVDSTDGQTAVVLVTDDGPAVDDTVTVTFETEAVASDSGNTETNEAVDTEAVLTETAAETELITNSFTGKLYIHSPLSITGYAGTVESVDVSENEAVYAEISLMTLTDTSYSANYDTILSQREELEDTLNDLIVLYREGGVYAPISGKVSSISEAYEEFVESYSDEDDGSSDENSTGQSRVSQNSASGTGDESSTGQSSGSQNSVSSAGGASPEAEQSDLTASGDTAAAEGTVSSQDGGESVVMTLDPNEEMTVGVSVDETDILNMQVGQTASITIDSIGEDVYSGTVTAIDTSASSSSGVTTYTVEVTLPRAEQMLSGMSADVEIRIDGVENAILVSSEAVHQTSSAAYVYTTYDEETKEFGGMTEVTTGLTDGSKTEIISGLKEGDTVWYEESQSSETTGLQGMNGDRGGMDFGNMTPGGDNSQRPGSNSGSGQNSSGGPSRSSGSGGNSSSRRGGGNG